jgi:hypothetical protein
MRVLAMKMPTYLSQFVRNDSEPKIPALKPWEKLVMLKFLEPSLCFATGLF